MNGFTIYREYFDLVTLLPSKEEQGELVLAIWDYMFCDKEPETLNESQMKIFRNLKRPLDKSKKRSLSGSMTNSNNNQKENKNESKQNQNQNKNKSNKNQNEIKEETQQVVNVYGNDNVNVNNLKKIGYGEEKPLKADDSSLLLETTKKVVAYLNEKTSSNFRYSSNSTQTKINARLNEGYNLDNFIAVIDKKVKEWTGTEFEKYLCPETLFGTKFEKYLNQKEVKKQKANVFSEIAEEEGIF